MSTSFSETTTEEVIDWLRYAGAPFRRINGDEFLEAPRLFLELGGKESSEPAANGSDDVYWYRRWNAAPGAAKNGDKEYGNVESDIKVKLFIGGERHTLNEFLFSGIHPSRWFDHPFKSSVNKLKVLEHAAATGLRVPHTLVTNDIEQLRRFLTVHERIITKPLKEVDEFAYDNHYFYLDTKRLTLDDLDGLREFSLSLFQEEITKLFEIRIFYINDTLYPMAIFSQRRKEAAVDFRNYDFKNPDRMVPYKLKEADESKIKRLVKELRYSHCSLDCIVNHQHELVFLEINPIGQFGMVSKPCNYNLEKVVANALIDFSATQHESIR